MLKFQPKEVAWIGDDCVNGEITGVVVYFHGLGGGGMKAGLDPWEEPLAAAGALLVYPYYGPWSWMNRQARAMMDALLGEVYRDHGLDHQRTPLILTGDSMGGCSALLYARYCRHPLAACYANCPVCDTVYHFSERADLPRTFYHAFMGYDGEMHDLLAEHSPLHQVAQMPDIDYMILHGDADTAVNKARHSDRLVAAMRARNLRVTYLEIPGLEHCQPPPEEDVTAIRNFMLSHLTKKENTLAHRP